MRLLFVLGILLLASCYQLRADDEVDTASDDDEDDVEVIQESQSDENGSSVSDIAYTTPRPAGDVYIAEHFDDREAFNKRWIVSEAMKEGVEENIAKYNGQWAIEEAERSGLKGDLGLVLKSKAHHHAIATKLDKPFQFEDQPFVLQYEVKFQHGQDCGGAYLKLLSQTPDLDPRNFHDKTPYTIMFGPDKCGNDHKLHFIFRHRNPKNGTFEEKHWKKSTNVPKLDDVFKDKKAHLFTLVITPDNKFEVMLDRKSVHKGSLLEDFMPPVNPPAEIDDVNDKKPEDWDEREKIPDPNAKKPDDWDEDAPRKIPDPNAKKPQGWLDDEPDLIPDPNAEKPKDWDDEMDGDWEPPLISNPKCEKVGCGEWSPPMIDNPKYKGKWRPPMIENPNYKGVWKPRKIPNPHFFEDKYPYRMTPVGAVGFELWSMTDGIMFDNIIITDNLYVAEQWAAETWDLKKEIADRETMWQRVLRKTNNHPYGWMLYLVYVSIPIGLYARHVYKRVKEDNVVVRLIKYTNKYPWLWAVYIVVIAIPVILFISFCCTTSSSSSSAPSAKERDAALRKKTDEPSPDDEEIIAAGGGVDAQVEDIPLREPSPESEEVAANHAYGPTEEHCDNHGSQDTKDEEADEEEAARKGKPQEIGDARDASEEEEEEEEEEVSEEAVAGDAKVNGTGEKSSPRRRKPRKE